MTLIKAQTRWGSGSPGRFSRDGKRRVTLLALSAVLTLGAGGAWANGKLSGSKTLVSAASTATGAPIQYRVQYSCSGTESTHKCGNARVVDTLADNVRAVELPTPGGRLYKVCAGVNPNRASCSAPSLPTAAGETLTFFLSESPHTADELNNGSSGQIDFVVSMVTGAPAPSQAIANGIDLVWEALPAGGPQTEPGTPAGGVTGSAEDRTTITKRLTLAGALDYETRYSIDVCKYPDDSATGWLQPNDVTVTDTLPAGAVLVEAVPPVSSQLDQELTWNNLPVTGRCGTIALRVNYPAGSNATDESKSNYASVTYTPSGSTVAVTRDATPATHTLTGPTATYNVSKNLNDSVGNVGQALVYTLGCSNPSSSNVPLETCEATDTIPPNFNLEELNSGGGALWYWKAADGAACPAEVTPPIDANGAFNDVVTGLSGLAGGEYVCRVRIRWEDVLPGTTGTLKLTGTVCNSNAGSAQACRSGANETIGGAVTFNMVNNASYTASYGGGTLLEAKTSGNKVFEIREAGANPTIAPAVSKSASPSSAVNPGGTLTFTLKMSNSDSYLSVPEQVSIIEPIFADLLPEQLELLPTDEADPATAVTATGSSPASCTQTPDIHVVPDYNGSTRTMVVFDWTGSGCELGRGDERSFKIATRVKEHVPQGSLTNRAMFLGSGNTNDDGLSASCSTSGTDVGTVLTGDVATPSQGMGAVGRVCEAGSSGFAVAKFFDVGSRKGVKGQLDSDFGYNNVDFIGRTVPGGAVTWQLEVTNNGNVALDRFDLIDILPFNDADGGAAGKNRGVGTNGPAFAGSSWSPRFVDSLKPTIYLHPSGDARTGTIYYTNAPNPCRTGSGTDPRILSSLPGNSGSGACNPMTTLAAGVALSDPANPPAPGQAGQWSRVLPVNTSLVNAFRIQLDANQTIPAGESIRIEYMMQAPFDAPTDACGGGASKGSVCTDVAWNSFGFQYHEVGAAANILNGAAPSSVGVIVQPPAAGTASYGNYVWYDTNQDGIQNEPAGNGINGVLVELLYDDGNGNVTVIGAQRTGNNPEAGVNQGRPGYYLFQNLPATTGGGRYFTRFYTPDREDGDATPSLWRATLVDQGGNDAADSDGRPSAGSHSTLGGAGWIALEKRGYVDSNPVTLSTGQHFRDADQGFYLIQPKLSLGNRVWYDTNNDGIDNDGVSAAIGSGSGIVGVTVQLWAADSDGNPAGGVPLATQQTNATGHYLFTELDPGNYLVVIPAVGNTGNGEPLHGLYSSGTVYDTGGSLVETGPVGTTPAVGRVAATSALDSSDHGLTLGAPLGVIPAGAVVSTVVNLVAPAPADEINANHDTSKKAPRGKTPGLDDPAVEDHSDLTIDFGFYNISALDLTKTAYSSHGGGTQCAASGVNPLIVVDPVPGNPKAVTWCFTATNHGAVALANPVFTDAKLSIAPAGAQPTLVSGSLPLAPGATAIWYYEATHTESLINDVQLTMTLQGETDPAVSAEDKGAVFAYVFDPPFGIKTGTLNGRDVVTWNMVWINDSPVMAAGVQITDPLKVDMTYVAGSLSCTPASAATTVTSCVFEAPSLAYPQGRVVAVADIAPDFGATDAASAANELVITLSVTVPRANTAVVYENTATAEWTPPGGGGPLTIDSNAPTGGGGPTSVTVPPGAISPIPSLSEWAMLALGLLMLALTGMAGTRRLR